MSTVIFSLASPDLFPTDLNGSLSISPFLLPLSWMLDVLNGKILWARMVICTWSKFGYLCWACKTMRELQPSDCLSCLTFQHNTHKLKQLLSECGCDSKRDHQASNTKGMEARTNFPFTIPYFSGGMHTRILVVSARTNFYVAFFILLELTKNKDLINWLLRKLFGSEPAWGNLMLSILSRIKSIYSH